MKFLLRKHHALKHYYSQDIYTSLQLIFFKAHLMYVKKSLEGAPRPILLSGIPKK